MRHEPHGNFFLDEAEEIPPELFEKMIERVLPRPRGFFIRTRPSSNWFWGRLLKPAPEPPPSEART